LNPPPSELPATAAPTDASQQQMLQAAHEYVAKTLPGLPNFLATRTVNRYDDSPQVLKKGEWPTRAGLHRTTNSSRDISIEDERELQPAGRGSAAWLSHVGLVSWGEFGGLLNIVMSDSPGGRFTWSHWETTAGGQVAVFNFSVPKSASHFLIISPLLRQASAAMADSPRGGAKFNSNVEAGPEDISSNSSVVATTSGYHGSLWIDPQKGTIDRITLQVDQQSDQMRRAAIVVQYGPVEIGGATYICPLRSVALSDAVVTMQTTPTDEPTRWLNETLFTDYHRFGSSVQILPGTERPD
jgi:hypothetical protein